MPPVPLDFLILGIGQPPRLDDLAAALASLRIGAVEVVSRSEDVPPPTGTGRVRLGQIAMHETLSRAEAIITIERHARPPLSGLSPDALDALVAGLDEASQSQARGSTLTADIHAQGNDPDRLFCLQWTLALVARIAEPLAGVIFDPAAQRCQTRDTVERARRSGPTAHVALHSRSFGPETRWLHTHGVQKFGQPELEFVGVPQWLETDATGVLRTIVETLAQSDTLRPGMLVDCEGAGLMLARPTATDAEHAAPFGRLRLVTAPAPGENPGDDASEVIVDAALNLAAQSLAERDWTNALRPVERVLAAMPASVAGLAMKARIALDQGDPLAGMEIAREIELFAPTDWRGPWLRGLALLAMGRAPLALGALSHAADLNPTARAIFETRARAYERLGQPERAAADRVRAATLGD
jgi:hypothetical protein